MYMIDPSKLNKGDIILIRSDSDKSKLIRRMSDSNYSHAMLYVGDNLFIDSDGPGVHANNIRRLLLEKDDDAIIKRARNISERLCEDISLFARSILGMEYSMDEAKKVIRKNNSPTENNRQFCTRFVAHVYNKFGIKIVKDSNYCSPDEIENSPVLVSINNFLIKASDSEIIYAQELNTPLEKQKQIINQILSLVRKITMEDIQTLGQIDKFLNLHPEFDARITTILINSGYLEFWGIEVEEKPFLYDFENYTEFYRINISKNQIYQMMEMNEGRFKRFTNLFNLYTDYYKINKLAYFKTLINLYTKLLELYHIRNRVFKKALEKNDFIQS